MSLLPLATPALPLDEAGKYVAGAYIVFLALILIYVAIMAVKLARIQAGLRELADYAEERNRGAAATAPPAPREGPEATSHEVEVVAEQMRR